MIAGKSFASRLIVGTGKYRTDDEMTEAIAASGADMVTVALKRIDFESNEKTILDHIDWGEYHILPNTAGCQTVEEALYTARLAKTMGISNWLKLEVIPDPKYLLPDPVGTLEAAKILIAEGFVVLPYINDDPILAKRLEEVGCATVMPLASPIGSGKGMVNFDQIKIIIEQANVPVVVDAGLGAPSDASLAMELGADAVLVNSAIALAQDAVMMADAMKQGVEAGRKAFRAGRIPKKAYASASSPQEDIPAWSVRS